MNELRSLLAKLNPGPICDDGMLLSLLEECWESIPGSHLHNTTVEKLARLESPKWDPPVLSFTLERHGNTVNGSSRAFLHSWSLNVVEWKVYCDISSYRQLTKSQPPLNTSLLVKELVELIVTKAADHRLKWNSITGVVTIKIGQIISDQSAPAVTVQGRRKRFRQQLEMELDARGWKKKRTNAYAPK